MSGQAVWTKEHIIALLDERNLAVARALLLIYSKQTAHEQNADFTSEENGVGLTKFDSAYLSDCAKFYQRNGFLSDRQLILVRQKIKKYWRQILLDMQSRGIPVSLKVPRPKRAPKEA